MLELRRGKSPDVIADLESGSAAVVICDPPWGTGNGDHQYGRRQKWGIDHGDPFIEGDINLDELRKTSLTMARVLATDGVSIVFCGQQRREAEGIMAAVGLFPYQGGVQWDKGRPGMSHKIRYAHEQILICATLKGWPHLTNEWACSMCQDELGESIFLHRRPLLSPIRCSPVRNPVHPNEKPVALFRNLLQWALTLDDELQRDSLVVDPFAGVCPSAIAAHQLGMRWVGAESDERWWPEADSRLANLGGTFGSHASHPQGVLDV